MKQQNSMINHRQAGGGMQPSTKRRGGAALIIVLSMTGMLMFLGFFFFSYISAERNSAAWFALSANREINDGDYFDYAMQQVLIGPTDDLPNSALYGRKWSLLPNMLGNFGPDLKPKDMHPYSGRGINIRYRGDNSGAGLATNPPDFFFDYAGTGGGTSPDWTDNNHKIINFSPAANAMTAPLSNGVVPDFEPDAGYTYPDINSLFLGHFSYIDDPTSPANLKKVWIPSFHRPQYLPRTATTDLYTNNAYRNRLLRPHGENQVRLRRLEGGSVVTYTAPRYVSSGSFHPATVPEGETPETPTAYFTLTAPHSGIWQDRTAPDAIQYDVDADGIAANGLEAILLDLDHRVETMSDGTKRIPMYAITIMDGDALLNLNVAGNLLGEETSLANIATPAGTPRFITQSNLGLSPSELNLGRALYRPLTGIGSAALDGSYAAMFGANPTLQAAMSNVEVTRLLIGKADGNPATTDDVVAGRFGEANLLENAVAGGQAPLPPFPRTTWSGALYPAPGQTNLDDNNNYGTGGGKALLAGVYNQDPIFGRLGIGIPSGVHPIDPFGVALRHGVSSMPFSDSFVTADREFGMLTQATYSGITGMLNPYGKIRMGNKPSSLSAENPNKWLSYTNRWELQADPANVTNMYDQAGVRPWFSGANNPGALQATQSNGALNYFLADEPDEIVIEPSFRNLDFDSLFSVSEMQFLQLSDTDGAATGVNTSSRLAKLANYNFGQADIRRQFTTDSWDRWEFGFSPAMGAILDPDHPDYGTLNHREWEFAEYEIEGSLVYVFPPEFDGAPRTLVDLHPTNPTFRGATHPNDPFRPELYQWLRTVHDPENVLKNQLMIQRRLNINRILDQDPSGKLIERHLTPHPVFTDADVVDGEVVTQMSGGTGSVVRIYDTNGSSRGRLPSLPANLRFENMQNNKFVQEWWAKYDRQRMARDIYVLLYTLGAGHHNVDPTSNATPLSPSGDVDEHKARCLEMAQFAVNYVDALDRDSVITEFIYDTNLSNGWNITGAKNADGTLDLAATDNADAAVVFGVEAQQLAFSEILWTEFTATSDMSNDPKTSWDDATAAQFLFVELRNASPFDVKYGTGTWRIRRVTGTEAQDPWVEFRQDGATGPIEKIEAGACFWVGTHNQNDDSQPAAIMVDEGEDGTIQTTEVFCPSRQQQTDNGTDPVCHLDLCHTDHASYFFTGIGRYAPGTGRTSGEDPGFLLTEQPQPYTTGTPIKLVLERRLNTFGHGKLDDNLANPWVIVDEIEYDPPSSALELIDSSGTLDITKLDEMRSEERYEPLSRGTKPYGPPDTTNHRSHTFGPKPPRAYNDSYYNPYVDANDATPEVNGQKTFTLWQPHFDRDFTSIYELLSVPIVGPDKLTESENSDPMVAPKGITADSRLKGLNTAFTKFAIPDPGTASNPAPAETLKRNSWYRILEFLEVPTSVQTNIKDKLPIPRTPGKINLNTLRHPGVLAAMIDDDYHLERFENISPAEGERYPYAQLRDPHENTRHWYEQFLYSRDRVDPVTNLALPGIPGSRPFRPLSFIDTTSGSRNAQASVEHTLLRSLPFTNGISPMLENNSDIGLPGTDWNTADLQNGINDSLGRRRLFEARTNQDLTQDAVDYHSRHRLLGKIANNTTVRSHLFYCWIYVQFHEAAEDEFGNAQVGGKLDETLHPPKRAFFVIDRSKLEEAWDPRTRTFDWRKFILLRKVLQ